MPARSHGRGAEHFLIVRLAALGDLVMTSKLVARIRDEHAGARISWLCGAGGAPVVRLFPGVDEVIETDERRLLAGSITQRAHAMAVTWRRIATRGITDVLIAHADPRFRLIALACVGARVRVLNRAARGRTNPIPGRSFGDEYLRLLDAPGTAGPITRSYDVADVRGNLPPASGVAPSTAGRRLVALVPGGARNVLRDAPMRRWPAERYAEVARTLSADGYDVALVGDDADRWVLDSFSDIPVIDLLGRLSLTETLGVLARASLVISHDTGPMHLARSVRAPMIALFGPTVPRQMLGAVSEDVDVLWGGERLACRPCYDGREFAACGNNLCMQDIPVADVLQRARARLSPHA